MRLCAAWTSRSLFQGPLLPMGGGWDSSLQKSHCETLPGWKLYRGTYKISKSLGSTMSGLFFWRKRKRFSWKLITVRKLKWICFAWAKISHLCVNLHFCILERVWACGSLSPFLKFISYRPQWMLLPQNRWLTSSSTLARWMIATSAYEWNVFTSRCQIFTWRVMNWCGQGKSVTFILV